MVCLGLDIRRWLLFLFFSEGFGLVPPLVIFSPFLFMLFLSLAVRDGRSSGCQPSWDVVASP